MSVPVLVTCAVLTAASILLASRARANSVAHRTLDTRPKDVFRSALAIVRTMCELALKHIDLYNTVSFPRQLLKDDAYQPYVQLPSQSVIAPFTITTDDTRTLQKLLGGSNASGSDVGPRSATRELDRLILVPLAFPLIPIMLSSRQNPIKPLGGVNVRNTLRFYPRVQDLLERNTEHAVRVIAAAGGSSPETRARRVKRGLEWDASIKIISDAGTAQAATDKTADGETLFDFTFTTLTALPSRQLPLPADYTAPTVPSISPGASVTWVEDPEPLTIKNDAPGIYASLSRDYNPIHMSSLLAKAFGFRGKIAHGFLVVLLACQRATVTSPDTAEHANLREARSTFLQTLNASQGSKLEMAFRRPVFVPSRPRIRWSTDGKRADVYETVKGEVKVLVELQVDSA